MDMPCSKEGNTLSQFPLLAMSQAKTVVLQHDMDDYSKAASEDVSHLLVHSLIRVSAIRL